MHFLAPSKAAARRAAAGSWFFTSLEPPRLRLAPGAGTPAPCLAGDAGKEPVYSIRALEWKNTTSHLLLTTYRLELDAIDDRSRSEDERDEAGEDYHRVKGHEEVIIVSSWKPETQISGCSKLRLLLQSGGAKAAFQSAHFLFVLLAHTAAAVCIHLTYDINTTLTLQRCDLIWSWISLYFCHTVCLGTY